MAEHPQVMPMFGKLGKAQATPLRRVQPSPFPHILGKNHWLSETASLAWSSPGQVQHLQPTALGWALAAASVTTKHKFSPCVRTGLDYLTSAFLPVHNSTGSCSEYFPTSGTWFWRSFFCLFVHWFYMKAWHYLSNKKMEAESIKFPLWRDPSANAVPSVILQEIKSTKINTALEQTH